ncbi:MAG: prepilin-type N-terminal cleavage/methylation domain-containing protein [Deltaproteobacteria bacterium]|nr:prepilin-type N-terminal cleavage/methylation domain-containing protein [Deltaproteobacteria bacterium]MBZ0221237.1 prepilin-type N-terminal cleavage/methylation domain-containing protein [Deltaproteobacteria bacterium]
MRSSGYSLVETIIALAIAGVLAAIAVPQLYQWSQSLKYKEAAWSMLSGLRDCKQLSMSTNLEHRVELALDSKRFRLARGDRPSGSIVWTPVRQWADLPESASYASGDACASTADLNIVFRPNGSAQAATLCIKDPSASVKFRINLNATSGRASIV